MKLNVRYYKACGSSTPDGNTLEQAPSGFSIENDNSVIT